MKRRVSSRCDSAKIKSLKPIPAKGPGDMQVPRGLCFAMGVFDYEHPNYYRDDGEFEAVQKRLSP
jgi:hypothetical protein